MAAKSLERLKRALVGALVVDRGGGPEDTVLVSGSGRSGTTWLAEILCATEDRRYLFEPLHPEKVRAAAPFGEHVYLRPDTDGGDYGRLVNRVLGGRLRSVWADRFNRGIFFRKRLVKSIRAALFLEWARKRDANMKIVHIVRHPLAVARSQGRMRSGFLPAAASLLGQPDLLADHLEPFRDLLEAPQGEFGTRLLLWCVQQYVALRSLAPGEMHVLFYEDLCTSPERELERLTAYLDVPLDERMRAALTRPSALSTPSSAVNTGADMLRSRLAGVPDADRRLAREMSSRFGLDRLYGDDPEPRCSPREAFEVG